MVNARFATLQVQFCIHHPLYSVRPDLIDLHTLDIIDTIDPIRWKTDPGAAGFVPD